MRIVVRADCAIVCDAGCERAPWQFPRDFPPIVAITDWTLSVLQIKPRPVATLTSLHASFLLLWAHQQ